MTRLALKVFLPFDHDRGATLILHNVAFFLIYLFIYLFIYLQQLFLDLSLSPKRSPHTTQL